MNTSNLLMVAIAAAAIAYYFWMRRGVVSVTAADVQRRLEAKEKLMIADVREPGEYQAGHIPSAVSVPLSQLEKAAGRLDPASEIVLVCASGSRSLAAYQRLKAKGFINLKNLSGGMVAWRGPIERR